MKVLDPIVPPDRASPMSKDKHLPSHQVDHPDLAELLHSVEHDALLSPPLHTHAEIATLDTTRFDQTMRESVLEPMLSAEDRLADEAEDSPGTDKQERLREAQMQHKQPHNFAQRFRSR